MKVTIITEGRKPPKAAQFPAKS